MSNKHVRSAHPARSTAGVRSPTAAACPAWRAALTRNRSGSSAASAVSRVRPRPSRSVVQDVYLR